MDMGTDMDTVMAMKNKSQINGPKLGILLILASSSALAQQGIPGSANTGNAAGLPSTSARDSLATPDASADRETATRNWTIKPRVSLTETYTDNANVNRNAGGKQSDLITEIAPGINIVARTARLKAYLDYSLREQLYAKESGYNRSQNALNSFGTFEAVDKWLFLDFSGVIAQQTISAFGTQSPGNTSINNNVTETSTFRLSPYIRGQFGDIAEYSLRYNLSTTRSDRSNVSDIDVSQWTGQVVGGTSFESLKWTVDGNQQTTDYSLGRKTDAELLRAILTYAVFPQFRVSLSGGWESNNYASLNQETNTTHGYGFDWTPTERTKISAFKEKRFFGDGHNINLSHRFPQSSIQFSDTRDVSVLPNQFATVGLGSVYDLYFQQFETLIPDPVARANFVNALLARNGISPNAQVTSGFTTSQATIRRNQRLSLVLFGARNSITLLANRSESQGVLTSQSGLDAISQSNVVKQQGFGLNLTHRLSEISNLNMLLSRQESLGSGANTIKTTTTLYQLNVSTKLGSKTTGSLSLRRTEFDSTLNPYTENALLGTVSFIY